MKISTVAIITVIMTKIFVIIATNSPTLQFIFNDRSYHFYYGLLIMIILFFFRKTKFAYIFFGVGAGLFIDDVAALKYVITGPAQTPIQDYWSPLFILPLLIGLLALVLSENKLKKLFPKYEQ